MWMTAVVVALQIAQPQPPATPAPPGTAILRGHVFAADTGQPLRKAQVRIAANEIRENRTTTTDENGVYEFKELRAGRYTVFANKGSYVSVSYGQQRPTDAPKVLDILNNQLVERVDLSLPRGSIVRGRVVDEFGEPAPEVQIAVERYQFAQGQRRLIPAGRMATTNDIGEFRLFGIPPGQYYLTATWRNPNGMNPNLSANDRTAYAPLYFPGTGNIAEAQRITLAAGQELADVVLVLKPTRASRASGTVLGADNKPLTPGMIMVVKTNAGFGMSMAGSAQIRPDGTFTVTGLAPGTYMLLVQRMGGPGEGPETATATVTTTGDDVSDLMMIAAKPSNLSGRVVVDPSALSALPPVLMIGVFPAEQIGIPAPPPPPVRVGEDFTFQTKSPPGRMRLTLGGMGPPPAGWAVKSVRVNGVDVTDAGIDFRPNEDITGVELELTNKLTAITGGVTDSRGEPAKDYTAIVFSQDREKWVGAPRYQGTGRPDQEGRFKISGLPPGDYYLVAVDRVEPGQWADPEFLENMRTSAMSVSLAEGETKALILRMTIVR
jgi:protocatechuate 3,4-dioxygenase beta subunit